MRTHHLLQVQRTGHAMRCLLPEAQCYTFTCIRLLRHDRIFGLALYAVDVQGSVGSFCRPGLKTGLDPPRAGSTSSVCTWRVYVDASPPRLAVLGVCYERLRLNAGLSCVHTFAQASMQRRSLPLHTPLCSVDRLIVCYFFLVLSCVGPWPLMLCATLPMATHAVCHAAFYQPSPASH